MELRANGNDFSEADAFSARSLFVDFSWCIEPTRDIKMMLCSILLCKLSFSPEKSKQANSIEVL